MSFPFLETQARQMYQLLNHKGMWSMCHCQNMQTQKVVDRRLTYGEEETILWAKENNGKGNVFIGRNPRTSNGNVGECFTLSLDLDPVKPKGSAATEQQWQEALRAGRHVIQGLGYGVLASSGNGALLLFPLRQSVNKDVAEGWGRSLEELARNIIKENGLNVVCDSTFDAPRLSKFVGAQSTKGNPSDWRTARFLDLSILAGDALTAFTQRLENLAVNANVAKLPEIEKGTLDRSQADISLANRLKLQGFSAEDALAALSQYSFRPERTDDHKRIIQKVFYGKGDVSTMVAGREEPSDIQLWTPTNGLEGYRNRKQAGTPELPTGFRELDAATFGLVRGHIYTVGGRTNCGKTTFAITVASHLCHMGKRVLFISTENQYAETWDRYIAAATGVSAFSIQNGSLTGRNKESVDTFIERFKGQQFVIYDGSRPSIHVIRQAVEQMNPDVLVLDYFQHIEGRETRELEEFVMQLHDLIKEKQVAALVGAQLHDGPVNPKTNKLYPPTMGNMKNCKVLNDESRVMILLDWDRDSVVDSQAAPVKIIMAKNKGPKADIILKLDRAVPRFTE